MSTVISEPDRGQEYDFCVIFPNHIVVSHFNILEYVCSSLKTTQIS